MPLKDVGNGIQQFVPEPPAKGLDQAKDAYSLLDLANRVDRDPLERQKLAQDVQIQQQTMAENRLKLMGSALTHAVTGNLSEVNKIWQESVNPNAVIEAHPDLRMRAKGWFLAKDTATGAVEEVSPFKKLGIEKQIDMEFALTQKARSMEMDNKMESAKWARDQGIELAKQGFAPTPEAGMVLATQSVNAMNRARKYGTNEKLLSDTALKNRIESGYQLAGAGIGFGDSLNQPLKQLKPLEGKPVEDLKNHSAFNNYMAGEVLPRFLELKNELASSPGLIGSPIQKLFGAVNMSDPKWKTLQTLLGDGLFKRVKEESGAAFTPDEFAKRRALMPNENDDLETAISKIIGLMSMSNSQAISTLNTEEANGKNVGGMRMLFQGANYGDYLQSIPEQNAQMFLNSLPAEVKANREVIEGISQRFNPATRRSFEIERKKRAEGYQAENQTAQPGVVAQAPLQQSPQGLQAQQNAAQNNVNRFNQLAPKFFNSPSVGRR